MSRNTGGGGVGASVTKCHMGETERGSKIGQKSVTYYLNGPYKMFINLIM